MIILKAQRDRPTASGILTVSYNDAKDCITAGATVIFDPLIKEIAASLIKP